jgi:outer membrane protein assembly factor BamE
MKTKIITFSFATCIALSLVGCAQSSWLYRVNVQQGNIVTPDLVQQLHKGMTKEAVCGLLGPPVLTDAFNENRWTYVYTFKPGRGKYVEANVILYFRNNRIVSISTKNIR